MAKTIPSTWTHIVPKSLAVLAVAAAGLGTANAASPCVPATAAAYVALGTTGCTIGSLTFYNFIYTSVASGGAPLITATQAQLVPIQDSNGVGFQFLPLIPMVASVNRTDVDISYLVKSTDGTNVITAIYTEVNGAASGGSPAAFDRVVEDYCAGPTGTSLPPDQTCPFFGGAPHTFHVDGPGTGTDTFSSAVANVSVDKDIDADARGGGTASITSVKNQFTVKTVVQPLSVSCPASTGQVGVPYLGALVAIGGTPNYTFSLFSGSLPGGLMLNTSTGAITGTPTGPAGTFSFIGQVSDSGSPQQTAQTPTPGCKIVIAPPPPGGTGCPATKGFWKNAKKHPFPDGITFPLIIAGVAYTSDDFYTILGAPPVGGNAVLIMGSQLVAAILNIAAGAAHSQAVDNAFTTAKNLLSVGLPGDNPPGVLFPINMTTAFVQSSTDLGTAMTNIGNFLDGYNSANFNSCSEGSGLTTGTVAGGGGKH